MPSVAQLARQSAGLTKQSGFGPALMKGLGYLSKQLAPKAISKVAPKAAGKLRSVSGKVIGNPKGYAGPKGPLNGQTSQAATGFLHGTNAAPLSAKAMGRAAAKVPAGPSLNALPTSGLIPKGAMPKGNVQKGMDIDVLPDWLQTQIRDIAGSAKDIPRTIESLGMDNQIGKILRHFGM